MGSDSLKTTTQTEDRTYTHSQRQTSWLWDSGFRPLQQQTATLNVKISVFTFIKLRFRFYISTGFIPNTSQNNMSAYTLSRIFTIFH